MNEVLTKIFWDGVKKTFDQALKGPEIDEALHAKTDGNVPAPPPSETPPSSSQANELHTEPPTTT